MWVIKDFSIPKPLRKKKLTMPHAEHSGSVDAERGRQRGHVGFSVVLGMGSITYERSSSSMRSFVQRSHSESLLSLDFLWARVAGLKLIHGIHHPVFLLRKIQTPKKVTLPPPQHNTEPWMTLSIERTKLHFLSYVHVNFSSQRLWYLIQEAGP